MRKPKICEKFAVITEICKLLGKLRRLLDFSINSIIAESQNPGGIACMYIYIYIYIYTVFSVNEYTPFEKYNFKQYLNEHKNHFQNVDKTKFNITSV